MQKFLFSEAVVQRSFAIRQFCKIQENSQENDYEFSFWAGFFWWVLQSFTEKLFYRKPENDCISIEMEYKTNLSIYVLVLFNLQKW